MRKLPGGLLVSGVLIIQTLQEIEVIVVVDGPDPSTREALAAQADPRLRIVELDTQAGAPAGWFRSQELGISPDSHSSSVQARDYSSVHVSVPSSGAGVPQSTSGSSTNPAARSGLRKTPSLQPNSR